MTLNTSYNKMIFLNTPSSFNGNKFVIWKFIFKMFIESYYNKLWEMIVNGLFIPTHYVNGEVVYKLGFLLTEENKTKFKINFKDKNFLVMTLSENQFLYVLKCKFAKEVWDTLEKIYRVSLSIEQ